MTATAKKTSGPDGQNGDDSAADGAGVRAEPVSAEEIRERFDNPATADRWAADLQETPRHRREARCVARGLRGVAKGARVLDLGCGAGRLLPLLHELGLGVVAADASSHMIERARGYARERGLAMADDDFHVVDALATPFADGAFDAVVCNRLLHHFARAETRRRALAEMGRICRGRIVVSFFRCLAYDACTAFLKHAVLFRPMIHRIPIRLATLKKDIAGAGLVLKSALGARPLISKQWYVVLEHAQDVE